MSFRDFSFSPPGFRDMDYPALGYTQREIALGLHDQLLRSYRKLSSEIWTFIKRTIDQSEVNPGEVSALCLMLENSCEFESASQLIEAFRGEFGECDEVMDGIYLECLVIAGRRGDALDVARRLSRRMMLSGTDEKSLEGLRTEGFLKDDLEMEIAGEIPSGTARAKILGSLATRAAAFHPAALAKVIEIAGEEQSGPYGKLEAARAYLRLTCEGLAPAKSFLSAAEKEPKGKEDPLRLILELRSQVNSGELLEAEGTILRAKLQNLKIAPIFVCEFEVMLAKNEFVLAIDALTRAIAALPLSERLVQRLYDLGEAMMDDDIGAMEAVSRLPSLRAMQIFIEEKGGDVYENDRGRIMWDWSTVAVEDRVFASRSKFLREPATMGTMNASEARDLLSEVDSLIVESRAGRIPRLRVTIAKGDRNFEYNFAGGDESTRIDDLLDKDCQLDSEVDFLSLDVDSERTVTSPLGCGILSGTVMYLRTSRDHCFATDIGAELGHEP
ncbi:MAG: hypothetical protein NUW37_08210 [Planctomycetes bacterium]|nr:hypothetical protein [Planctomycetota bacterium]